MKITNIKLNKNGKYVVTIDNEKYNLYQDTILKYLLFSKKEIDNTLFENNNIIKASARHEKLLTLEDILRVSKYLLKNNGRLAMVHRMERLMEILFLMKKYNIEPKKIRFVYPNNAKNSDLVLIEGTLNGKSGLKIMNPLFVYVKKDVYSKEVKDMFGE